MTSLRQLIISSLTQIASLASIIGAIFIYTTVGQALDKWRVLLLIAALVAFLAMIVWEWVSFFREKPKRYPNGTDIRKYMCRWVSKPGRVVIFTRDLSWAADAAPRAALMRKARAHELKILIQHENQVSNIFKNAGAEVISYGHLGHVPRARFTIVGADKDGARVAIGAPINGVHTIEEFESGKHPLFSVAEDLINFLGHRA